MILVDVKMISKSQLHEKLTSLHDAASIMILMWRNSLTSDWSGAKRERHAFQREFDEKVWQWRTFSDAKMR